MATASDHTTFRTITEDGMLGHEHTITSSWFTVEDFEAYDLRQAQAGNISQWYVVDTEELLAESSEAGGVVTYPAADLFA